MFEVIISYFTGILGIVETFFTAITNLTSSLRNNNENDADTDEDTPKTRSFFLFNR